MVGQRRYFSTAEVRKSPIIPSRSLEIVMESSDGFFIYMIHTKLFGMVFRYNIAAIYTKSGKSVPAFGYITQADLYR